jgi:hypothetical protein
MELAAQSARIHRHCWDVSPVPRMIATTESPGARHPWKFEPGLRRHAFGWRSQPAVLHVWSASPHRLP